MSHEDVLAAIARHGGSLRASFDLDAHGRTVGDDTRPRIHHCAECGERGHNSKRCRSVGQAPREMDRERRMSRRSLESVRQRITRADHDLQAARVEIARRIAAKAKK
jgi:hypothetical protein